MKREIRTRERKPDIKVLDRSKRGVNRIERAAIKTKDAINEGQNQEQVNAQEYADKKALNGAKKVSGEVVHQTTGQIKRTKDRIRKKKREKNQSGNDNSRVFTKEEVQKKKAYETNRARRISETVKTETTTSDNNRQQHSRIRVKNRQIQTAEQAKQNAVLTAKNSNKRMQKAMKESAKRTYQAKQFMQKVSITVRHTIKKAVTTLVVSIKSIVASIKGLIAAIGTGGSIAVFIVIIVVLFGGALCMMGGSNANAALPVSDEVEAYEPVIRQYARQYGISEYVDLIKAIMMQESSGRGLDPMQSSEGAFNTRYPNVPNGITDPDYSIQCGVQEIKACLESANVESPIDMENIKLALQGYNYGNGYISWAKRNYGGYSALNAAEFSDMMAQRLGWNSYGDKQYVAHVLRYYPFGRIPMGIGNTAIVQVALSQEGNVGGQPYWSWYGFNSRVEWCACFVSWCADQCGYIDARIIPKFALCSNGAAWFDSRGQFQDGSYVPMPGDIIFFDWGANGDVDHVGIVEYSENGVVHTIEGNSGDSCRKRSYVIGNNEIYGYGVPAY